MIHVDLTQLDQGSIRRDPGAQSGPLIGLMSRNRPSSEPVDEGFSWLDRSHQGCYSYTDNVYWPMR